MIYDTNAHSSSYSADSSFSDVLRPHSDSTDENHPNVILPWNCSSESASSDDYYTSSARSFDTESLESENNCNENCNYEQYSGNANQANEGADHDSDFVFGKFVFVCLVINTRIFLIRIR